MGAASSSESVAKLSIPTSTPTLSFGAGATSFFGTFHGEDHIPTISFPA